MIIHASHKSVIFLEHIWQTEGRMDEGLPPRWLRFNLYEATDEICIEYCCWTITPPVCHHLFFLRICNSPGF